MVLAVVLSALVLLGWTMFSDRFLPAAPPPHAQSQKADNGKAKPATQQQQATPASAAREGARGKPAGGDPDAQPAGLDQPDGCAVRRPGASQGARVGRQEIA